MKNKYLLFLAFIFVVLFASLYFPIKTAALEINYPSLPLVSKPSNDSNLGDFAVYWFAFLIYAAAALSLISFTIGAIGLIASTDNAEASSNAKDRMKGSILGLILTLAAFVVLKTINPALTYLKVSLLPAEQLQDIPTAPGVYLYLESGCGGKVSGPFINDINNIEDPFDGKLKSVRIINDSKDDIYYGAIFHKEIGLENGGECDYPIVKDSGDGGCEDVHVEAHAADIFRIETDIASAGDGVEFYSEPYGWNTGSDALRVTVTNEMFGQSSTFSASGCKLNFFKFNPQKDKVYNENVDQPDEYKYICPDSESDCGNNGNSLFYNNNKIYLASISYYKQLALTNCLHNSDCPTGQVCVMGSCQNSGSAGNNGGECVRDTDCPNTQRCDPITLKCITGNAGSGGGGGGSGGGGGGSGCNPGDTRSCANGGSQYCSGDGTWSACNGGSGCNPGDTRPCPNGGSEYCSGDGKWSGCKDENGNDISCSDYACETFQDCPGSIKIKGTYLVALYSKDPQDNIGGGDNILYCQTFRKDVENLNTEPFKASGDAELGNVFMIPTK